MTDVGTAWIVVDPLYGDSGKGKVASVLADRQRVALAVEVGSGPAAAHEIVDRDGHRYVTHMIPPCFTNRQSALAISRDVLLDVNLLEQELRSVASYDVAARLCVDADCRVADLTHDVDLLRAETSVRASADFARLPVASAVPALQRFVADVHDRVASALCSSRDVVLVVQHGTCVTRGFGEGEVIEWRATVDAALAVLPERSRWRAGVVVKTLPTRILAGPLPNEMTWPADLPRAAGKSSGRWPRIAAAPDLPLLKRMSCVNRATDVFVTFADFLDRAARGVTSWRRLPTRVRTFIADVERALSLPVSYVSTGPAHDDGVWLCE